jgi:hypothetical protein
MARIPRDEPGPASQTLSRFAVCLVLAAAVRIEAGRAVRAQDPQILQPVVVAYAVDVIEDQADPAALPVLTLPTELTTPGLQALGIEPPLET